MLKRLALSLAIACTAVPAMASPLTYDFVGTCTDCTGQGKATLVVGTYELPDGNVVTFTYAGTNLQAAFTLAPPDIVHITGSLPAASGYADIRIITTNGLLDFWTSIDGSWQLGSPNDYGTNGVWSLRAAGVPEPMTGALLLTGLAGLGLVRRRTA